MKRKSEHRDLWRFIACNLAGGLAVMLLLLAMAGHSGYTHAVKEVIGDHGFIKENRGLALEERLAAKLGTRYTYFRKIKESTPEDAIIWLPGEESFLRDGFGTKFNSHHSGAKKLTSLRFLYPRKVVLQKEYAHYLPERVPLTHVVIVSGEGAFLLPYAVPDTSFGVFPVGRE